MSNSRRDFCKNSIFVGLGLSMYPLVSQADSMINKPISKLNLSKIKNKVVTINGKVLYQNLDAAQNAIIEVWHNNSNNNQAKFAYKGNLKTDDKGNYSFETDFPEKHFEEGNSTMRRIFFKIKDAKGTEKQTKLYFGETGKAFVDGFHIDNTPTNFKYELPKTVVQNEKASAIQFNIYL